MDKLPSASRRPPEQDITAIMAFLIGAAAAGGVAVYVLLQILSALPGVVAAQLVFGLALLAGVSAFALGRSRTDERARLVRTSGSRRARRSREPARRI